MIRSDQRSRISDDPDVEDPAPAQGDAHLRPPAQSLALAPRINGRIEFRAVLLRRVAAPSGRARAARIRCQGSRRRRARARGQHRHRAGGLAVRGGSIMWVWTSCHTRQPPAWKASSPSWLRSTAPRRPSQVTTYSLASGHALRAMIFRPLSLLASPCLKRWRGSPQISERADFVATASGITRRGPLSRTSPRVHSI